MKLVLNYPSIDTASFFKVSSFDSFFSPDFSGLKALAVNEPSLKPPDYYIKGRLYVGAVHLNPDVIGAALGSGSFS